MTPFKLLTNFVHLPATHWPLVVIAIPFFISVTTLLVAGPVPESTKLALTLDQAVQIALMQNPQVLTAKQEVERERGQVVEVRAQAFPRIALNASYQQISESLARGGAGGTAVAVPVIVTPQGGAGAQEGEGAAPTPSASPGSNPTPAPTATARPSATVVRSAAQSIGQDISWQISIQARYTLYSGGRVRSQIKAAKLSADASIFKLRDVVDRVISDVRKQFYQVLLNQALITVQEESIRLLVSQLEDQRNRFEAGLVPRFNVLQAEVALANARPALIQARNNYRISQLQLAKTLGYETRYIRANEAPFELIGTLGVPAVQEGLASALMAARERRPFLKAQRQNILIEVENITGAAAGYRPTLEASGGYRVQNSRVSRDLGDTVQGWFLGVDGSWNVFDGLETFGKLKQARAKLESARVNYEDSIQQVELEVQQAWANLLEAKETIASQQKNLEQAREAVRLAQERLSAGAGTQLDVLNSTVQLTQAQTTELQARSDYNTALAEIDRATGADTKYAETFDDPLTNRRIDKKMSSNPSSK